LVFASTAPLCGSCQISTKMETPRTEKGTPQIVAPPLYGSCQISTKLETVRTGNGTSQIDAPPLIDSCRLGISITLMLGSFVASLTTSSLSFAIVCINQNSSNDTFSNSTNCSENEQREPQSCVPPGNELFWSKNMQGLLLGGTFYGTVASQILIGYISDKYGYCKLQMLIGASVLGIANIISPLIIIYLGDYYFFAMRIIMGLAMACMISSNLNLVRHWASPKDQGLLVGLSMGGISIANALINPISATICYYSGWSLWIILAHFGMFCCVRHAQEASKCQC